MKVSKILYHGTTMARWSMIKKGGLLRCSMPKSFDAEEFFTKGYVYFTTDPEEAIIHGLGKSILDYPEDQIIRNPSDRDPVVLGINGLKLGDNLEINDGVNTPLVIQRPVKINEDTELYRHKGNIKAKHLFLYKHVPIEAYPRDYIKQIMKCHEDKLHASESIMKQLSNPFTAIRNSPYYDNI